jgi:glycerophosphoryl diester phosphodiesterase
LDAGSWFDQAYCGAKVPLLRETLERYGNKTHLVLEIKQSGIELEVLAMVQQLKLIDSVTFTSFDFNVVKNIKSKFPRATLEWLLTQSNEDKMKKALEIDINQISLPAPIITKEIVASWNAIGIPVRAWKVIDTNIMISAIEAGVVGMTVDFPDILLDFLQKSGKR